MSSDFNVSSNQTVVLERAAEWGWMTKVIVCHVVVAVGLVANSLTFVVMKMPRMRYKSYSHYLSALAVFDSLVLLTIEIHMVDEILLHLKHSGLFSGFTDEACKVFMFADSVCNLMSSWLIVAMAIERLCVVYMPFRRNMWCQQRGAIIIIFTLFCVMSCSQVFRFVMVENTGYKCGGSSDHFKIYFPLHIYVYQFVLLFISPVLIVLVCNIGVVIRVFSVERATQNEDSSSTRLTGSARRRSKTTRMLVAISFTYIITTLPQTILTITIYVMGKKYGENGFRDIFLRIIPWMHIFQAVSFINYASNFFIYILSGKKFRIELRRIFAHDRANSLTTGSSARTRDEILMMSY